MEERERKREIIVYYVFFRYNILFRYQVHLFQVLATCECEGDTGLLLVTTIKEIVLVCVSVCLSVCAWPFDLRSDLRFEI